MAGSRYDTGDLRPSHLAVLALIRPGSRVLETGCSTGFMTRALDDAGCTVTATDVDAQTLAEAAPFARGGAYPHDLDQPFPAALGGPFDHVVFADVLEHLVDPATVLRRTREVLAPGGTVVVSIPNVAFWHVRWSLLRGRFDYTDTGILDRTHLRFYTLRTMRQLFGSAGYVLGPVTAVPYALPLQRLVRRLPARWQQTLLATTTRRFPALLGYQFVVAATPA